MKRLLLLFVALSCGRQLPISFVGPQPLASRCRPLQAVDVELSDEVLARSLRQRQEALFEWPWAFVWPLVGL